MSNSLFIYKEVFPVLHVYTRAERARDSDIELRIVDPSEPDPLEAVRAEVLDLADSYRRMNVAAKKAGLPRTESSSALAHNALIKVLKIIDKAKGVRGE